MLQIVHRTLAAMLGSLAALAALATVGEVSCQTVISAHIVSGYVTVNFHVCADMTGHMTEQSFSRERDGKADIGIGKHLEENKSA